MEKLKFQFVKLLSKVWDKFKYLVYVKQNEIFFGFAAGYYAFYHFVFAHVRLRRLASGHLGETVLACTARTLSLQFERIHECRFAAGCDVETCICDSSPCRVLAPGSRAVFPVGTPSAALGKN